MKKILAPALLALLSVPQLVHAQAYKCKQPNGTLAFQDHPCQAGVTGSMVALPPVQGYSAVSPGQSIGSNGSAQQGPGFRRRGQDAESEVERANRATEAYNAQVMAENKARRCSSGRRQLAVLNEQRPVYHRDDAGNKVYVEDKDRPAAISAAQQTVETECP